MKSHIDKRVTIALCLIIFTLSGTGFAMNIFKNDFEQQWPELSQDVEKLNEYTKVHSVEMRNMKVEGLDLEGVIFSGSTFSEIEWENIDASKSSLTKVTFRKCKFIGGSWKNGTLTDVTFEGCDFIDTSFSRGVMNNVHFKDCKIERTGIAYLTGSRVEFDGCAWNTGAGGDSSCEFIFKNSSLSGISFSKMENNVPLLIENSRLNEINFYGSHFSTVTLRHVKQGEGGVKFNNITAETVTFENVDMTNGTAIARSHVKSVIINGGKFGTTFDDSIIGTVHVRDTELYYMEFSEVKLPKVTISNSKLYDTGLYDGFIEEFSVYNSEFNIIDGENFKADIVVWDNVTLDGKIDLSNAQINDFRPSRIKRGPKLNLITDRSNISF